MDGSNNNTVVFVVLWLLSILTVDLWICRASSESEVACIPSERHALLTLKLHLLDPSNRLSSWSPTGDCCKWPSIVCSNVTGHILQLNLNISYYLSVYASVAEEKAYERSMLGGEIHPSLLDLKHLNYLDLSGNDFGGMQIPTFLSSMKSLTYLNLSNAGFNGSIPPQIGNLSKLLYLDLGGNDFSGNIPHQIGNLTNLHYLGLEGDVNMDHELLLTVENLRWMSAISSIKYLKLSYLNLSKAFDWLHVVHSVPSLTELHLQGCALHHYSQPTTINFSSLLVLGISYSFDFGASSIPKWIFQLQKLVSLLLPENNLQGSIPDGIQNLTLLEDLDLSINMFNSSIPDWLYGFSHLKFLNLVGNNMGGTISNAIGNLTSLVTLYLFSNQLECQIPRSLGNLCNLRSFSLSIKKCNQQVSEILEIFSGCILHTLEMLYISGSQLSGYLTDQIGFFKSLVVLALPNNAIRGALPTSLGKLTSLKYLSLSRNQFNGNPFEALGSLSELKILYLDNNIFQEDVNEAHLANFTSLIRFEASTNQLTLKVGPNWKPSFQLLETLEIASWHLGPEFPSWIQSLKHLVNLDMSNTSISKPFPTWFWGKYPNAQYFNLSRNYIHGELSIILNNSFTLPNIIVDLSWNMLSGQLLHIPPVVIHLDLSNNWFFGSMTRFLCPKQEELKNLEYLNLASNNLSGEIPDCWMLWPSLVTLKLESNHFTGNLPPSMGSLTSLKLLHLRNNGISGQFPLFLKNVTELISLDLGENEFLGIIPSWIKQSFLNLKILRLRSNNFSGAIPHQICDLRLLQILDFSKNNFTGHIPKCVNHLRAIQVKNNSLQSYISCRGKNDSSSIVDVLLMLKGRDVEYSFNLGFVTSIDLSDNKLSGEIPIEIIGLMGLNFLNLSNNLLSGQIPQSIGDMGSLQTLDFSKNQLCGEIPTSISNLNFLSMLNLSYNHLKGKIPTGTQLQTFDASSFVGNHLCGPPLIINCTSNGFVLKVDHNDKEGDRINWFVLSMAMGFVMGFWGVVGPLLYHRSWRYAYFQFLDCMWYKLQSCWC